MLDIKREEVEEEIELDCFMCEKTYMWSEVRDVCLECESAMRRLEVINKN